MTVELLQDVAVLFHFSKTFNLNSTKVSKEIFLNLLDHLLKLYILVRSFSYSKEFVNLHKIKSKKKRTYSLKKRIQESILELH